MSHNETETRQLSLILGEFVEKRPSANDLHPKLTSSMHSISMELDLLTKFVFEKKEIFTKEAKALIYKYETPKGEYKVIITPAIIGVDKGKQGVMKFPSEAEYAVYQAIRYMGISQKKSVWLVPEDFQNKPTQAGIYTTTNEIVKHLEARGKTKSHTDVLRCLEVLSKAHLKITFNDEVIVSEPYIGYHNRYHDKTVNIPNGASIVVRLPIFESTDISEWNTVRQINYEKSSLLSVRAEQLYKHLTRHWLNASRHHPIKLEENLFIRNLMGKDEITDYARKLFKRIVKELKDNNIIESAVIISTKHNERREIGERYWEFKATDELINEVKEANRIAKQRREKVALEQAMAEHKTIKREYLVNGFATNSIIPTKLEE